MPYSSMFSMRQVSAAAVLFCLGINLSTLQAAATDLAAEPVITLQNVSAKPNLMFVLDDSGSMAWDYMPDELGDSSNNARTGVYGYWSSQCNGLAYNPLTAYDAPVTSTGSAFSDASFTNAKVDGFSSGSSGVDLSDRYYYAYATTGTLQTKLNWTFSSSGAVDTGTTFYQECMSNIGSSPGSSKFTKVLMSSATAAQKQNYANWFSFYKYRYILMRTAVGRAVQALDSGYRIGFSRINSTSISDGSNFRDAKDFDATQKANFYSSLYGASPGGGTPLRGALSKIGRYFGKRLSGQTYDPMQYACQRNYALLTTDGYWNLGGGTVTEGSSYGPLDLNGNNVGNQDATEVRPMYDGGNAVQTSVTPTTKITLTKTNSSTRTVATSTRYEAVVLACSKKNQTSTRTTLQIQTVKYDTTATSYSEQTDISTRTVVVTNGVQTGDTTTSSTSASTPASPASTSVKSNESDSGWASSGTATTTSCSKTNDTVGTVTYTQPISTTSTTNLSSPVKTVVRIDGPTVGATTTTISVTGGTSNTLADVAQYYYAADLRTSALGNCSSSDSNGVATNVCSNIVPAGSRDKNTAQHMSTFTIGLGVSGSLSYDKNYLTQTASSPLPRDYYELTQGTKTWPAPTTSLSGSSGDARNIDDLWHAAVNGRGQYYSALDSNALSEAIQGVAATIKEENGAGGGASFNTLTLTQGADNRVYQAGYTTSTWSGELKAFSVNGEDGSFVSELWSAQAKLDAKSAASRQIYYRPSTGGSALRAFTATNLTSDGYIGNFTNLCSKARVASQCSGLSAANLVLANTGTNLVNFLRGDRTYELGNATSPLYRSRAHVLGDIINGAPVAVSKPPFAYTDAGYASYAAGSAASRASMVYTASNDGMLHAFSATTGDELWAYVPTAVMPEMYRLANSGYASNHTYLADGEPVVGDIFTGGVWKTILVAGLNSGGKAYYALDITDPANPKTLWEFTQTNLGLSFGNPIITKRIDGTWVVVFASGYNNTGGDGKGRLYVLDANSGTSLLTVPTTAGSSGSPSGLVKINAWIDKPTNNTSKRFYGGDLLGNLWRFDIDNQVRPNQAALLLAQLQTAGGLPQPITTRPETLLVAGTHPVVAVGTGRYLGVGDISNVDQQGLYVLRDALTETGLGVIRNNTSVVKNTLTVAGNSSIATEATVDWNTQYGWWFDLPNTGERIVTSLAVVNGRLLVPSAIPSGDACTSGGSSWLYRINFTTGQAENGQPIGQLYSEKAVIVGTTVVRHSNGDTSTYIRDSTGETKQVKDESGTATLPGPPRRSSWRELVN